MNTGTTHAVRRLADWDFEVLRALAGEFGTPLYVLDLDRVRENYRRIQHYFPDAEVCYAAKANTSSAVLRTLCDESASIECASAGEIDRAHQAGFPPGRINYTAVNPPGEDLDYAVALEDLTITIGAMDTMERLDDRGFTGRLSIRVNPGVGAGHHEHVTTGTSPKFGLPYDRAIDAFTAVAERDFDLVGIHAHAGSGIVSDDLATYREFLDRICRVVRELPFDLEFVDIGGGFGVPYHPDEQPLELSEIANVVRDATSEVRSRLVIEPGRYVVADAGTLLTRVNTVKPAVGTTVIGVDAGMNTLIRPALYDAYHHIANLESDASARAIETVTVTGPICESADVLGDNRSLASPARGDLLGIGTTGAYGFEMASQYNSRPRPAIVAIEDGVDVLVRERETYRDLTQGEHP